MTHGPEALARCTLAAALAMALVGAVAGAQPRFLRGTVVERIGDRGLGGVVLELLDSTSTRVATTMTNAAGAFVLRVPRAGTHRIDVRRIGFRRRTLGPFVLGTDTTITLVMEPIPQTLPAITASERTTCVQRASEATATGVLWESANTAMLASEVAMRDGEYEFELASQHREYRVTPAVLTDVRVALHRVRDVRPWTSLPAADLARHGFVHLAEGRAMVYVAPDLELLTSAAFANSHCFTVREDARAPALLGLVFQPDASVRRADVRGILWLARESLELRSLEFSFTGIQFSGPDTLAGGRLVFTRLDNDAFVPTEWTMRSPAPPAAFLDALERRRGREGLPGEPLALSHLDPSWSSNRVVVSAGTVMALRRAADSLPLWQRETGELDVLVRWRRGPRGPAAGVRVVLGGLGVSAHTDQQGRARFSGVPPGDYIVSTSSEEEEFLQLPRDERLARVRGGEPTAVALTALPPQLAVNSVCEFNRDDTVLAGIARLEGRGTTGARIRVELVDRGPDGRERTRTLRTGWSGGGGLYHICRVPRGALYVVSAIFPDGRLARERLRIPSTDPTITPPVLVRLDLETVEP